MNMIKIAMRETAFKMLCLLSAVLSSFSLSALDPSPDYLAAQYVALPFVAWRNNLLFANAVLNRLPSTGPRDFCCKPCGKGCPWHTREELVALGEVGNGEVKFHGRKFDYNTWGASLAADVIPCSNLLVGAAFSGMMNNFSFHHNGGNGKLKHFQGGGYFNYIYGNYFVGGLVTGGWNESRARRSFLFSGLDETTRAHQSGYDFSIYLQEGMNMNCGCWLLTPLLRVGFTSLHEHRFYEGCHEPFDLQVRPWITSIARAYLEGKISRTFELQGFCILPQVFAGWAFDSVIGGKHIKGFVGDEDAAFSSKVWSRNQNSIIAGAEVDAIFGYGLTGFVRYDYQGNKRYTSQTAQLGVTYVF